MASVPLPFRAKIFLLFATFLGSLLSHPAHGQPAAQVLVYYTPIAKLLQLHQTDSTLMLRLDSLRTTHRHSRSTVTTLFNRDIDFDLRQRRVAIHTNIGRFQLDLATSHGQILALTIAITDVFADSIKPGDQLWQACDTVAITQYLARRNGFYQSRKTLPGFFKELQDTEQFAPYCGDTSPQTPRGAYIENLARNNQVATLAEMLGSIHCETQAYAVLGFSMLKAPRKITPQHQLLLKHIKTRNSIVITCQGCLSDLPDKLY